MQLVQVIPDGQNPMCQNWKRYVKTERTAIGVPQGGILSTIIFTIYGAKLEEWTKNLTIFINGDDNSSSKQGQKVAEVVSQLEEDKEEILKLMASNGLVATPTKTTLLIIKQKRGRKSVIFLILVLNLKFVRNSIYKRQNIFHQTAIQVLFTKDFNRGRLLKVKNDNSKLKKIKPFSHRLKSELKKVLRWNI